MLWTLTIYGLLVVCIVYLVSMFMSGPDSIHDQDENDIW